MLDAVQREVEEVHRFIQMWIRGDLPGDDGAFAPFRDRFADDFALIGPGGAHSERGGGVAMVRGMHATNPDFEIWVDSFDLVRVTEALVVATYAEWQRHAVHSRRGFNGRWSTVVFERVGDELRWAWLHETWIPDEVLDAIERSG